MDSSKTESVTVKVEPRNTEQFYDESEINNEGIKVESNLMDHFFYESELEYEHVQTMPIEDILGYHAGLQEIPELTQHVGANLLPLLNPGNIKVNDERMGNISNPSCDRSTGDSVKSKLKGAGQKQTSGSRKSKSGSPDVKPLRNPKKFAFREPDVLQCDRCNVKFIDSESVCVHLKDINSKPFICNCCGKLFKSEYLRNHHKTLPHIIPCTTCKTQICFVDSSSLNMHVRSFHKTLK